MNDDDIFFVAVKMRKKPKINKKGRIQKILKNVPLAMNSWEVAIVKINKAENINNSCFLDSFEVFLEKMNNAV